MPRIIIPFPLERTGTATLAAGDDRRLTGLAVPYGVPSGPSADGLRYQFAGPPDNLDEPIDIVREHNEDALIGVVSAWSSDEAALTPSDARLFATTAGNDALVELSEGARTGLSIGAEFTQANTSVDDAGVIHINTWSARHLGLVRRPAFTQSRTSLLTASASRKDPATMTDPTPAAIELPTIEELADKVAAQLSAAAAGAPDVLAEFATFAQFTDAYQSASDEDQAAMHAAFAVGTQTTTGNDGVMLPTWRSVIKKNLDARQPAIAAFGSVPLPESGMEASWPYYDGNLDTIIAEQAAQLDALNGVKIDIKRATQALKTAGTASTVSWQLLYRSDPSYRAAYLEICLAAYARFREAKFEARLVAGGINVGVLPALGTAKAARDLLFAASVDVDNATGAPADIALVDTATWKTLGGLDGLHNPAYGVQNVYGTASAATLEINVNGLRIRRAPFLGASTMVVSNSSAAKAAGDTGQLATADDVTKLGTNIAVWGMYEDGEIYFPAGVRVYKPV